jgi:hypothetical protein
MWTVESELEEAFSALNLPESDLRKCSLAESTEIQTNAMQLYVNGNPRSWWMGLKRPHLAYNYDFPSDHIVEHMPSNDERVWWIPETEQEHLYVYDVRPLVINKIMEKTAQFEYYVLRKDLSWLIIETDHGELWVIEK